MIAESFACDRLEIAQEAALTAPEGKFLTLTVNKMGFPLKPGTYVGDIRVSVTDLHHQPAHGLHRMGGRNEELHTAVVVADNSLVEAQCTPAIVQGGKYDGDAAEGIYIASCEDNYNGIVLTGQTDYTVKDSTFDLEGTGANDFMGAGAGIAAMDNTRLTVDNCAFTLNGRTRCAIHAAGDSVVDVKNSRFIHLSKDTDDFLGDFSWGCGFWGANRVVQLCDDATAYYTNCDFYTNGWGVFSIDGCNDSVRYFLKDCRLHLSGPETFGYGVFAIGDRNVVKVDHCDFRVNGYPVMVRGFIDGINRCEITNGTKLSGLYYGIIWLGDKSTPVKISDTVIDVGRSAFLLKVSAAKAVVERCRISAGNGTIIQLMANDEVTQMMVNTSPVVPVRPDEYIEGRDLTAIDPAKDCEFIFRDMDLTGNMINSTNNLHLEVGGEPGAAKHIPMGGMFAHLAPPFDLTTATVEQLFPDYDDRGPKNLKINLESVYFRGIASAATQHHRDDLEYIDEKTRMELSNITQTPAPVVNNGVILHLDAFSTWVVTDTCYLSALQLDKGAIVKGLGGKKVVCTVDGVEVDTGLDGGSYKGHITVSLRDWLPGERQMGPVK